MTFGEKLYVLRKQNNISQEKLAFQLNVSRQAVSKWEMGAIPDVENILKIAGFFDCSLDYLLNDQYLDNPNMGELENYNREPRQETGSTNIKSFVPKLFCLFSFIVIFIIWILSYIVPVPLFRREGNSWLVGVRAFIEYYHCYELVYLSFIICFCCTIVDAILETVKIRSTNHAKKLLFLLLARTVLVVIGIFFIYYRFFHVSAILWNVGMQIFLFLYFVLLSATILKYYFVKKRGEKQADNREK